MDKAASIRLGDPADLDTQMGPLISQVSQRFIYIFNVLKKMVMCMCDLMCTLYGWSVVVVCQAQLDRVEYYVQVARDEGAKVHTKNVASIERLS